MQIIARSAVVLVLAFCLIFNQPTILAVSNSNSPVYNSNSNEGKKIALTFDDGPHPRYTPKILEILDKYNIKATFFVIGVNARNYPEALSQVIKMGHEVGNHTYSHKLLKAKAKEDIYREIISTEKEISKFSEAFPKLIRPPCGMYDKELIEIAEENEYKIVLWNIDTKDWTHASSECIVSNVISRVKGGDIILFHDYISGENNTCDALQIIIPKLLMQGYEFVTAGELLQNV
ncbi:MAG: polysaccharide deacetylase family protein [Ruminococcaceae bacterium]|nr:polysaccharide deacetylase family protein [Oscillospiraceae bacterium]